MQLTLPGIQQMCPACRQPAQYLGQWSPLWPYAVCRECSKAHPYPLHVLAPSTRRNADKEPLMIAMDASSADREYRVLMEGWLRDAALGCMDALESEWGDSPDCWLYQYRPDCKRCAYRLSNTGPGKYAKMGHYARVMNAAVQLTIPICERCGLAHDHCSEWLVYDKCERCTMLASVEALHRHRGIFGDADDETILDRLYVSHQALFDAGVLPDYWFELQEKTR